MKDDSAEEVTKKESPLPIFFFHLLGVRPMKASCAN